MADIASRSRMQTHYESHSWVDLIEMVIAGKGVQQLFQPIIRLNNGQIAGYEALARFDEGPPVAPNLWFSEAARRGVVGEFEAAVLRPQLALRHSLPRDTFLSVNVEPESLLADVVLNVFREHAPLNGVVVEVTEHRGLVDPEGVRRSLDRLRDDGALVAVDDAGAGYAGLQQILQLEPQILKLDRSLISGLDDDETKASLVEMLGVFAGRIGATILAEGIETEAEARTAADLGVELGQGYYFGKPSPPWASPEESVVVSLTDHIAGRSETDTLRSLLSPHPSIEGSVASLCTSGVTAKKDVPLVLTRNARPIGLASPLGGDPVPALVVSVNTYPQELANRLAAGPIETIANPVLVTNEHGHYIGVVTVRRLLRYLASS